MKRIKTSLNKGKLGACGEHTYPNNGTGSTLSRKVKIKNGTLEELRKEKTQEGINL